MVAEFIDTFQLDIPARKYWHRLLTVDNPQDITLFEINVGQQLDICVYIVDSPNYYTWTHNVKAMHAGAAAHRLPSVMLYSATCWKWGTLGFTPPGPGNYYLILDNTNSTIRDKNINLTVYKLQGEEPLKHFLREECDKRKWSAVWSCFQDADTLLSQGKLASCCDNLSRGLISFMTKSIEALSGEQITYEQGKSADVGVIKAKLKAYIPDYTISPLMQAWNLASKLSKTKRHGTEEPPLNQVLLARRMVYASAAYVTSIQ